MRLIDIDDDRICYVGTCGEYKTYNIPPDVLEEGIYSTDELNTSDCSGCRFVGNIDYEFPCRSCVRREKDYYSARL